MSAPVDRFDLAVESLFDHLRGRPMVDRVFYTASELGDWSLLWQLLAVARGLRRGGDLEETIRVSAIMGLESAIVNGGIKSFFRRQRPTWDDPRPHKLRVPRTSSFPSGHATAATVFAIVAGEDDSLAPVYVLLGVLVAASRIHVRIHHGSDVVGGVVVGAALGKAFQRWWPLGAPVPPPLDRVFTRR